MADPIAPSIWSQVVAQLPSLITAGAGAALAWRASARAAGAEKKAGEASTNAADASTKAAEAKTAVETVDKKTDDQTKKLDTIDSKADVAASAAAEAAHNTNNALDDVKREVVALTAELVNAKATIAAQNKLLEMLTNARRADDRLRLEPPKPETPPP